MKPSVTPWLLRGLGILVLLAVFWLYTRAEFVRDLADLVWSCV